MNLMWRIAAITFLSFLVSSKIVEKPKYGTSNTNYSRDELRSGLNSNFSTPVDKLYDLPASRSKKRHPGYTVQKVPRGLNRDIYKSLALSVGPPEQGLASDATAFEKPMADRPSSTEYQGTEEPSRPSYNAKRAPRGLFGDSANGGNGGASDYSEESDYGGPSRSGSGYGGPYRSPGSSLFGSGFSVFPSAQKFGGYQDVGSGGSYNEDYYSKHGYTGGRGQESSSAPQSRYGGGGGYSGETGGDDYRGSSNGRYGGNSESYGGGQGDRYGGGQSDGYGGQSDRYGGGESDGYGSRRGSYGGGQSDGYGSRGSYGGGQNEGYGGRGDSYGGGESDGYGSRGGSYGGGQSDGYGSRGSYGGGQSEGYGGRGDSYGGGQSEGYGGDGGGYGEQYQSYAQGPKQPYSGGDRYGSGDQSTISPKEAYGQDYDEEEPTSYGKHHGDNGDRGYNEPRYSNDHGTDKSYDQGSQKYPEGDNYGHESGSTDNYPHEPANTDRYPHDEPETDWVSAQQVYSPKSGGLPGQNMGPLTGSPDDSYGKDEEDNEPDTYDAKQGPPQGLQDSNNYADDKYDYDYNTSGKKGGKSAGTDNYSGNQETYNYKNGEEGGKDYGKATYGNAPRKEYVRPQGGWKA